MFVSEGKIIPYPSKSIIEDLLSRYDEPDEFSTTPFAGCKRLFDRNFRSEDNVSIQDIVAVSKDFSVHKSRANDDGADRELAAIDIADYYTRLEDIDNEFVEKYILEIIIGYKMNNNGLKQKRKNEEIYQVWEDADSETMVDPTDVMTEEKDYDISEIIEAKTRLPYLLKQLHTGSIEYGGSLLSFVIASEKFFRSNEGAGLVKLKPSHIVNLGVYQVNTKGDITSPFVISQNTGRVLPRLFKWICGADSSDHIYYSAAMNLVTTCQVLGIDITKEDPRDYTSAVIENAVSCYLASNQEYIESYGYVDRSIMDAISPDQIWKVANSVDGEDTRGLVANLTLDTLIDSIAANTEVMKFKYSKWEHKPAKIKKFCEVFGRVFQVNLESNHVRYNKDILQYNGGGYVLVPLSAIGSQDSVANVAIVSKSGFLIKVKQPKNGLYIEVMDIDNAIKCLQGGSIDDEWTTFCI